MAQVHPSRLRLVPGANDRPQWQHQHAASSSTRTIPRDESREEQLRRQLMDRRKGNPASGDKRESADGGVRQDGANSGREYHRRSVSPSSRSPRREQRDRRSPSPPRRELFPKVDSRRDRALSPRRERDDRIPPPRRYDDPARDEAGPSTRHELPPHLARGRGDNGYGPRPTDGGGYRSQGPMPPFPPQFPPRNGGGGGGGGGGYGRDRHFGQNLNLEQRRQQREASTISIWPPSPKAPYKDEDEVEAERLAARRTKSKSKRKHRSRYSSDSESSDEEDRRRHRRRRERKRYSSSEDSSEEDRRRSRRGRKSRRRASDSESEEGSASEAERTRRRDKRDRRTGSRSAAPDQSALEEADEWVEKPVKSDKRDKAEETSKDKAKNGRDDQPLTLVEMAEMQRRKAEEDTEVGPQLPAEYTTKAGRMHFKDMRPGEAAAMAAYASNGERIPRRGEIGQDAEAIKALEESGYVMSGSRHRRMNAVRLRKENQVISAEEKRAILNLQREEKERREGLIVSQFKELMEGAIKRQGG